jgi:hypothetical protein
VLDIAHQCATVACATLPAVAIRSHGHREARAIRQVHLLPIISSGNATSIANILIRIQPGPFQLLPDFSVVHDPEFMTEEPTLEGVGAWPARRGVLGQI